jgi:hypothetical protein
MPQRPRFDIVDVLLLVLTLGVAAGVRVVYVIGPADKGHSDGPLLVQDPSPRLSALPPSTTMHGKSEPTELDALVHNLSREGRWFGSLAPLARAEEKTAHVSPGYPWLLSWLAKLASGSSLDALVRWIQCALGALTAGLYFLFAQRAFRSRVVATLAGLLCAVHPFWVINTAALNDGTVTTFLLALVLYLSVLATQTGGAFPSLMYGLSLAALALLRAPLLPFAFVAVMWFLLRCRRIERGWLCALLAFLGFANGLGPWTLRNFHAFGVPVPLVDSAYLHLWMGNNRYSDGGPQSESILLAALAERRGEDPEKLREKLAQEKSQPKRYSSLASDVATEVRAHPAAFLEHRFEAGVSFLFGATWLNRKPGQERHIAWPTGDAAAEGGQTMLLLVLLVLLPLGLVGWRWTYAWRDESMPAALAIFCVPLPYLLSHAGFLHGPRMPLDGILLTYAAFVLACIWPATAATLLRGPVGEIETLRR